VRRTIAAFAVLIGACRESAPEEPRTIADVPAVARPTPAPMTPDELAETRRKAGFLDGAALAEERAAAREGAARAYVRTRLRDYRDTAKLLRRSVDEIEAGARRWARAKEPQHAYERWRSGSRRRAEAVSAAYQGLSEPAVDGGMTLVLVAQAYRSWQDLKEDLSGDVGGDPRFIGHVGEVRAALDAVDEALDEIERDEELQGR